MRSLMTFSRSAISAHGSRNAQPQIGLEACSNGTRLSLPEMPSSPLARSAMAQTSAGAAAGDRIVLEAAMGCGTGHDDAGPARLAGEALGAVGGAVVGQDGLGHDRVG